MNSFFQTLAFTYLLYPILGLLLVGYSIGAIAILRLPVLLGFLDYGFMPINYIALMVIYLILGRYNTRLMGWDYSVAMPYNRNANT